MKTRNRCFTLLEILIVIALLSFAAGLVGINIHHATREQSFNNEVEQVVELLNTAQNLMLMASAEVRVVFKQKPNGIEMKLVCDDKIPEKWAPLICKNYFLKTIHQVYFDSASDDGKLTLSFLSKGSVMSKGVLTLIYGEKRYIPLPGYPAPIRAYREEPEIEEFVLDAIVQLTKEELSASATPSDPS